MGLMRFKVHTPNRLTPQQAARSYMAGHDRVPWPSETVLEGEFVTIKRPMDESGNFYIPIHVDSFGELILGTATLRERERPYNLMVELARGKLNQVRNQISEWQSIGLAVPERLSNLIRESQKHFAKAATCQDDMEKCIPEAESALKAALDAANLLASSYADQALAARKRQTPQLRTLLGGEMGNELLGDFEARQFRNTFNTSIVPFNWRYTEAVEGKYEWGVYDAQVEWCQSNKMTIWGGPLLLLDNEGLPDWLQLWQDDFDTLMTFVSDYVETVVARYRGKVHVWEATAKTNVSAALGLNEEQRLRLTVRAIESTRRVDPDTDCIIRIDQPWAEYMTQDHWELSPIHFADALARADLGVTGVNLEINVGYHPGGSPLRDQLEFSRLLDLWSYLGLPLYVTLTFPTSDDEDKLAFSEAKPIPDGMRDGWNPLAQRAWVEKLVPLILAKRSVAGVMWKQLFDKDRHEFPHGGLFNGEGRPKPALATLATMRKYHLK